MQKSYTEAAETAYCYAFQNGGDDVSDVPTCALFNFMSNLVPKFAYCSAFNIVYKRSKGNWEKYCRCMKTSKTALYYRPTAIERGYKFLRLRVQNKSIALCP